MASRQRSSWSMASPRASSSTLGALWPDLAFVLLRDWLPGIEISKDVQLNVKTHKSGGCRVKLHVLGKTFTITLADLLAIFGVNSVPEGTKFDFATDFCDPQVTRETVKVYTRRSATHGAGGWHQKFWGTGANVKEDSGALWDVCCGLYSPEATV